MRVVKAMIVLELLRKKNVLLTINDQQNLSILIGA